MTTPATMNRLLEDLRDRFDEAVANAAETMKMAPNSYGAGYNGGYADALGELLESLTGDPSTPQETTDAK